MSKIMQSKHFKYIVLALLFLGWCLGNLDRFVINYAIVGITEDLGLGASAQGIILSSFFLGYAIMQIPGGALADRFGYRKVILVSLFSWSIFTILTGSAWSLLSLIFVRFLFGIGEGSFFPSGSKAIATNFPVNQRSGAMSIMLASAAIMGVVTPILTGHALVTIGWRNLFYIIGAAGILITALMFFLLKEPAKSALTSTASGQQPRTSLKDVLKTPMIWNLFISYFSIYAVNWGLQSWMPTYMVNVRGLDMTEMGLLAAIPAVVSIFTMLLSGYVLDRIPAGKDRIIASVFGVLVAFFLYLMGSSGSIATFITYMTIVTAMAGFISTLIISKSLKTMPESVVATANGFINTGAQLAGFLTPMLIGFLVEASGGSYATAFIMLIAFALICSLSLFFSRRSKQDSGSEVQATAV
ncbi:MFS transporter [Paenibacillus illinoisensis]|uniref:MFS transporter n=1 Tax=Paenibacillus illinoisensis TaxID=59845 RepID=UPI00203A89C1|nr:MFS transporter [Paenibacillus illinoisensis]MCM3206242.1 MFS transporter [Paenibacillus illinoisensis]